MTLKPLPTTKEDVLLFGVLLVSVTTICLTCLLAAAAVESLIMRKLIGPQPCICVPAEGSKS